MQLAAQSLIGILFSVFTAPSTFAAATFAGQIAFTDVDRTEHAQRIDTIIEEAAACVNEDLAYHQRFYFTEGHGFSPFYGENISALKPLAAITNSAERERERLRILRQLLTGIGKPAEFASMLQSTSCIGMTIKCLRRGFERAGQGHLWQPILVFLRANRVTGNSLLHALSLLGWRMYYWNPDPTQNAIWDYQEQLQDPTNETRFWGQHVDTNRTVNNQGLYYINEVHNNTALVGFQRNVPRAFLDIPFFVGIAHLGYHVFPGAYGQVIEAHSTRPLNDPQTVESSPFNPLQDGGGPRGLYRTGLMALPPGYDL